MEENNIILEENSIISEENNIVSEENNIVSEENDTEQISFESTEAEINADTIEKIPIKVNDSSVDIINYVKSHIRQQNQTLVNNDFDGEKFILQTLEDNDKDIDGTITETGLKKLNLEAWNKYPWECIECTIDLGSSQKLIEHFKAMHDKNLLKFKCCDCSNTFSKYLTFVNHVRKRHRTHLKYCCDVCCTFYWNTKQLKKHRNDAHENAVDEDDEIIFVHTCWICNKKFKSNSSLIVHQKSHLPEEAKEKFKCDVCDKEFMAKPNLLTHKRIHSGCKIFINICIMYACLYKKTKKIFYF